MRKSIVTMLAITGFMSAAAFGADREIKVDDRLDASADTLIDMMRASDQGIPQTCSTRRAASLSCRV